MFYDADFNDAISNIIETDIGNSTPIQNPALTGNLRITARADDELDASQRLKEAGTGKHYHAKTTYTKNYTYITLYLLSILASLAYILLRIYYIANGLMRQEIPSNTSVVDTSTCDDISSDDCSNKVCGPATSECSTTLVGDLLSSAGITVSGSNNVISPDVIAEDLAFKGIKEIMDTHTYSYWWSIIVLAAEIGGFVLVHLSQQMFIRQDTKFYEMAPDRVAQLKKVRT